MRTAHSQRGFSLIEVVVAFAVMAVGMGIVMQIAVGSLRQARNAAELTEVSLYAQSLLDSLGVGQRLDEGRDSGRFGEHYHWELDVTPYEVESDVALGAGMTPVVLYRLDLRVYWERGQHSHETHYSTLRALTPQ